MRLKLNRTLRAALIAAITAAGFTLTQAQADTAVEPVQLTITPTEIPTGSGAGNSGFSWTNEGVGNSLTSWRLTFTLKETRSPMTEQPLLGTNGSTSTSGGDILKVNANGSLTLVPTNNRETLTTDAGVVTYNTPVVITLQYVAKVDDQGDSLSSGTYSLSVGENGPITLVVNDDPNAIFYGNTENSRTRMWTNSKVELFSDIRLYKLADEVVKIPTLTWHGSDDSNWSSNVWFNGELDTQPYTQGAKTIFGDANYATTVNITDAQRAGDVQINAESYTFNTTSNGSLTMAKLSITEGASLSIAGEGTVSVSGVVTAEGDLSVVGGTLNLEGERHTIGTLTIAENGVVTTTRSAADGCITGDIVINGGGMFKVTGGNDAFGWSNATKNISLTGESADKKATLALLQNSGTTTMKTNLVMNGFSAVTGALGFNSFGGTINVTKTGNSIEKLTVRKELDLTIDTNGELTIATVAKSTDQGNGVLNKKGEGALKATGAFDVNGLNISAGSVELSGTATIGALSYTAGSLIVNGGTTTVSGENNVLNKTITVQNGVLQLRGTYDITGNEGEITATYSEGDNGFKISSGTITVYTKGEGAEVTIVDGTQFIYGTAPVILTSEGKYVVSAHTDYSTYHVRVGSANFSSALERQDTKHIEMSDSTTLNMDTSGALTSLTTHGAASLVNVGEARHSLTLGSVAGEGTVAVGDKIDVTIDGTISGTKDLTALKLASGATAHVTMGTGREDIVNFGEGSGTVVLEGGSLSYRSELHGNTLQMQSGSTLLFGNKGTDTDHTYEGNIVVAGNASVTTYGTSQHPTATISGAVSGDGTLTRANDGNQALNFTGTVNLRGYTNNDAQDGNLTDFRGVTKIGTLTVGNASNTKFSNADTTIGAIVVNGSGSVEFTHNFTLDNVSSTGNHALTLKAAEGVTITLSTDTEIYKLVSSGAGYVKMAEDTTISLGNNLAPVSGTVEVYATLNVAGDIDLSSNGASTAKLSLKDGSVTTAAGMWMASGARLLMEEGAVLNIGGLQIEGTDEGGITTTARNAQYDTNNDDFTIANATVTSTGNNVTLGNVLTDVSVVVADGSSLTLNSDADSVTVNGGGTFTLGEGKTVTTITVNDGGTIADGVDATDVTIKAGATAIIERGVSDIDNGVFIYGMSEKPTITNNGQADAKYAGLQDEKMQVAAETLWSNAEGYTVKNVIAVESIVHAGGELTLAHVDATPLDNVEVSSGSLVMQDVSAAVISSLEIASGASAAVYTDETATAEGTITITETLVAGGGTLYANLTIADADLEDGVNPILDVNGGGDNALTLGSQFTIAEGTLVTLDAETIAALEGMQIGQSLDIIRALEETGLTYGEDGQAIYDGMWFDGLFARTTGVEGDYLVYATGESFGLTKVSNTPEPTTGTLSLLALAALAARRRKHN